MSDRSPSRLPTSTEGRWLAILRDLPCLPAIPAIRDWLLAQRLEITSDQNASYAGQHFDPDRFPVVSRLVFRFFETPSAHELFVLKPVQSTFTTHVWFALCHALIHRPCTGILVMHTRAEVRKKKKDTYAPIIAALPELAHSQRIDGTETTAEEFRFKNATLYVGGGQSASVLTSTAANIVILDEAEQHGSVGDTTTINLGRGRITAGNEWRKLCAFSKPEKEARFEKDDRTGILKYLPEEGTYLHAEYLSGNQLRYECPCPHCGVFTTPDFPHIRFAHCNEALPGHPPLYNKDRILRESYWQCPHCEGTVHEGPEKHAWVLAGRWIETPLAERREKEMYPRPHPKRWSAHFSAFTDIAFDSLTWGHLVLRFLDAQNDPVKLRAFNNEIRGLPEPTVKVSDTTLDHLKRLIPDGTRHPRYRIRDDHGDPVRIVPCLQHHLHYIGMAVDVQIATLKWSVRAHYRDGTAPLLDHGIFPRTSEFRELTAYIDTIRWECLDGPPSRGVAKCYVDVGGEGSNYYDVLDLSVAHPRIEGIKGEGMELTRGGGDGIVWVTNGNRKGLRVEYFMVAAGFWERRLYEECIQKFPDPYRYRAWAPDLLFPEDIEDTFLYEFTHMRQVWERGKIRWSKPKTAKNDYADCDRMHLVMDWNLRLARLMKKGLPGTKPEEIPTEFQDPTAGTAPVKEYRLQPKRPRIV